MQNLRVNNDLYCTSSVLDETATLSPSVPRRPTRARKIRPERVLRKPDWVELKVELAVHARCSFEACESTISDPIANSVRVKVEPREGGGSSTEHEVLRTRLHGLVNKLV